MILYMDTSALVKVFIEEEGRELVKHAVESAATVTTSVISYAECRSAFSRRYRDGDIDRMGLQSVVDQLTTVWPGLERLTVTDRIARQAGELAERHTLRGFDAIHLATALRAGELFEGIEFLGFDDRLNDAARSASLQLYGGT